MVSILSHIKNMKKSVFLFQIKSPKFFSLSRKKYDSSDQQFKKNKIKYVAAKPKLECTFCSRTFIYENSFKKHFAQHEEGKAK